MKPNTRFYHLQEVSICYEGIVEPGKEISFFDQVDFVKSFCYLGDRLKANGGGEAAVTARTRIA